MFYPGMQKTATSSEVAVSYLFHLVLQIPNFSCWISSDNTMAFRKTFCNNRTCTNYRIIAKHNARQDNTIHPDPARFTQYYIFSRQMSVQIMNIMVCCNDSNIWRNIGSLADCDGCINSLKIISKAIHIIQIIRVKNDILPYLNIGRNRPSDM